MNVSIVVRNAGGYDGEEVVQLYLVNTNATEVRSLKGFQRIYLKKGEKKTVSFNLRSQDFATINATGERVTNPGIYQISVGGKQPTFAVDRHLFL